MSFGLQLAHPVQNVNHARNYRKNTRNYHNKKKRKQTQLQHYPRDRAHLANSRYFAGPTWFHSHFVADEQMQNHCADKDDRVACNHKDRKPRGKASIFRIGLTPVADTQCDDAAQKQTFVCNWIEIYSERAALVVSARNISVQSVAYGRENKNDDRRETLPFQRVAAFDALAIINRHRHKNRDHQNPDDSDLVGSGH